MEDFLKTEFSEWSNATTKDTLEWVQDVAENPDRYSDKDLKISLTIVDLLLQFLKREARLLEAVTKVGNSAAITTAVLREVGRVAARGGSR